MDGWAAALSAGQLHRLWQLLLKGFDEVRMAPDPLIAAEMALLRVMHAADLPDPGTLMKRLEDLAERAAAPSPRAEAAPAAADPVARAAPEWRALVQQVEQSGQLRVSQIMHDWVRPVAVAQGALGYELAPGYPGDPTSELRDALLRATGERWEVNRQSDGGQPTLRESAQAEKARADADMRRSPLVQAALAAFPQAEFITDDEPAPLDGRRNSNWRNRA